MTNFGCEKSGQCKKRLQPYRNAHLTKRVLDIGRTHKPVLSVLERSLKFDMAKSFPCEKRSRWKIQKMLVAFTRINDEPLSPSLLGHELETNGLNSRFNKPSLHQITNQAQVVTPAVLENWINVTTGWSQRSFQLSNLRTRMKCTLLIRIQVRTS